MIPRHLEVKGCVAYLGNAPERVCDGAARFALGMAWHDDRGAWALCLLVCRQAACTGTLGPRQSHGRASRIVTAPLMLFLPWVCSVAPWLQNRSSVTAGLRRVLGMVQVVVAAHNEGASWRCSAHRGDSVLLNSHTLMMPTLSPHLEAASRAADG